MLLNALMLRTGSRISNRMASSLTRKTVSSKHQQPSAAGARKPLNARSKQPAKIRNSNYNSAEPSTAVKKISNIQLSDEQQLVRTKVLDYVRESLANYRDSKSPEDKKTSIFIINGDAGTGKSVILNSLFNHVQKISKTTTDNILSFTNNYLVVNHPEMLKLYHQISKQFPYIKKTELERPTSLINSYANPKGKQAVKDASKPVDVLVVDEAHLLATSKDAFKRFNQENHLEELIKLSKVLILVFDDKQSLRMGSFWNLQPDSSSGKPDGASLSTYLNDKSLVRGYDMYNLKKQFRVVAQDDLLSWIQQVSTTKKILPLPTKDAELGGFDFKIFENCETMHQAIQSKNKEFGQSRLLATYDFPYRLDGKDYFVYSQSDNFKLRWDRYLPQITTPWSERDDTIDEVGSVYTVQGFDLNYAGVILGRSVGYDKDTDSIKILPEFYDDNAGFTKKKNINNVNKVKERIILNSINVLLTRGVKGLYLFAWNNELRARLLHGADPRVVVLNN